MRYHGPYTETGLGILLLFWLLVFMGYWVWEWVQEILT